MNGLASTALDILWHNVKRFAGIILIGVLLIGLPYIVYSKGYTRGYSKGYSTAITERPTYGSVGTVINKQPDEFKIIGLTFNLWRIKLKLGI